VRVDLLALTPEALAALSNRGLVKRAAREIEEAPPELTADADGTLHGAYADGPVATLPPGGLDRGGCTCGATGVCRHVVGLVLAYQADQAHPAGGSPVEPVPTPVVEWSPGEFDDGALEARIGARLLNAARRARRAGYLARIHRPTAADPAPRVELGSATVRFLVPHDLGFVHTDAVAGARDDVLALAVWAFRAADERAPGERDVRVDVGGAPAGDDPDPGRPALAALRLADEVLLGGAVHVGAGLGAAIADVRQRLDRANLRWPLLAVDDLAGQLEAYRDRGSRYAPERLAAVVAELHARHRAVANRGGSLRARVLGTEEAAETPLRRARLDSLGCRVRAIGTAAAGDELRVVEVFFAHADSATTLVLRRAWTSSNPGAETAPVLARRRLSGMTVAQLAAGTVVTESAIRSASRTIRLATSRIAKTTVTPSAGAWDALPDALLVRDLTALATELDRLPPRMVRPRVEAELVRVVRVAGVRSLAYAPGAQRLDAVIADEKGGTATISLTHTSVSPGALDAMAAALDGRQGPVRFVSGTVRRGGGGVVIDPLAFALEDGTLVVPDLAGPATGTAAPAGIAEWPGASPEPFQDALDGALALLAEVPHRGLRHLPPTFGDRLRDAGDALARTGLHRAATALAAFRAAIGPDPGDPAVQAWTDAYLRLSITADLR